MAATVSENNTRVTFTLSKELKESLDVIAKRDRRSLSNLINIALEEYVKKEGSN